ncbi:MAG: outer membrane protein assembly factor BamD [Desulfuromonadales bacterium]|jgi:outer membrane protein assembly factor BamD
MRKTVLLLLTLSVVLLTACGPKTAVPPTKDAGDYFQEGEDLFEKGLYKEAIEAWEKVRDSYYSPELNTLAELKIADAHFLAGDYIEAGVAYEAFLKNHPDHPRAPDVLYQLGLSYTYQMLAPDQDQTATVYALNAFQRLKERFPDDPRMAEVEIYIARCRNMLAASELNVAEYYLNADAYAAAINRIEGLLAKYPDFYQRDKAYFLLGRASLLNGDREKAMMAFQKLFDNFSSSEYVPEAQSFLEDHQ